MTTPPPLAGNAGETYPGERADLAYVLRLGELERDGARCPVDIGPYSLFTLIGAVQLSLRYAGHSPVLRTTLTQIVACLAVPFAGTHGETIIAKGWNPDNDMVSVPAATPGFGDWLMAEYDQFDGFTYSDYNADDMAAAFEAGRRAAAGGPQMTP